jgi:hypothetical protein
VIVIAKMFADYDLSSLINGELDEEEQGKMGEVITPARWREEEAGEEQATHLGQSG